MVKDYLENVKQNPGKHVASASLGALVFFAAKEGFLYGKKKLAEMKAKKEESKKDESK